MASNCRGSELEKKSQSKITALKDQVLDCEEKLHLAETNEEQLSQEILRLQSDVLTHQKEIGEIRRSSQDALEHLMNELEQRNQEIRELKAKNREDVRQLEEAKKVQQSKDEEIESLRSMIKTLGKQTEAQSKYAEKQEERLRTKDEQILELQSTLATQKAEIDKLQENHNKQITEVKKMLQQKDQELSDLRSLIDDNERVAIDREEKFKQWQKEKEKQIFGALCDVLAAQSDMEKRLSLIEGEGADQFNNN